MMQHGEWARQSTKTMPNINEYSFEEDFDSYRTKEWPVNSLTALNADDVVPVPRLKIRVCEEREPLAVAGTTTNVTDWMASFESTSSGEYSDSYCEVNDDMDDDRGAVGDGEDDDDDDVDDAVAAYDDWFDESYFYADPFGKSNAKCTKCGHKSLVKQFTNSFEA